MSKPKKFPLPIKMAMLKKLCADYPKLFNMEKRSRPMKIGVAKDIERDNPSINKQILGASLRYYSHSLQYQLGLTKSGVRHDLDGTPCGVVSDDEKKAATAWLKSFKEWRTGKSNTKPVYKKRPDKLEVA